jgi:hypothetical protein
MGRREHRAHRDPEGGMFHTPILLVGLYLSQDSLMKIDEPKTPFVRYNAETDTIEGGTSTALSCRVDDSQSR